FGKNFTPHSCENRGGLNFLNLNFKIWANSKTSPYFVNSKIFVIFKSKTKEREFERRCLRISKRELKSLLKGLKL
ncbi:MAG: hypothetical protein ABDI07_06885, partial [Candidatus Kryptonium sp.]